MILLLMPAQMKSTNITRLTDQQQVQNHRDDVLIAQLHSGHHLLLKAHQHWTDPEIDLMCPSCKQAECTLQHWLIECPAGDAI